MGKRKPVALGTRTFASQTEAHAYFKAMLARYNPGDPINAGDQEDLAGLLARHPNSKEKIGIGIDHFEVQEADFGSKCFRVVRPDGSWSKFSFHVCVAPDANWDDT